MEIPPSPHGVSDEIFRAGGGEVIHPTEAEYGRKINRDTENYGTM